MPKDLAQSTSPAPLPMTPEEVTARGWEAVDIVFVTGDAYVDHPSFAMALLGRLLESEGYRVAILSQPDWRSCEPWRRFGRPRICYCISAGNMDSMLNHYTANRKVRNDDAYSPGGEIGRRPDRATLAYCQRAREAYSSRWAVEISPAEAGAAYARPEVEHTRRGAAGVSPMADRSTDEMPVAHTTSGWTDRCRPVPIIAGGVEASLRRIAHYDYWSDKVRRSILLDAKADLVVFGMGERPLVEVVRRLAAGETVRRLRDIPGVAYRLGASEAIPSENVVELPSYEEVAADRRRFAEMTRLAHRETNPYCARRLVQRHGREAVVINSPAMPLSEAEMDRVYGLPYTRRPHPSYGDRKVPAMDVIRHSIQVVRGCFGGCAFCSITAHEGRVIQSRSEESVVAEAQRLRSDPDFKGTISDVGGPTANMYRMGCTDPAAGAKCRRLSCLHPSICKLLDTNHGPLIELLKRLRRIDGVRNVYVASGIRTDLAQRSPAYISDLVRHHVGGHLKVAPEHCVPTVLALMKKPSIDDFQAFARMFQQVSHEAGKPQYLVPYFIAGHPGCDLNAMIQLAVFLKQTGYRPQQVQDFYPGPFDVATCMYHTGLDPATGREVYVAKTGTERRRHRALMQFYKPEHYDDVLGALVQAGRTDLIGNGADCLIPAQPPRVQGANSRTPNPQGNTPNPPGRTSQTQGRMSSSGDGYRPHRTGAKRRRKK